jgi:hypothetical protein
MVDYKWIPEFVDATAGEYEQARNLMSQLKDIQPPVALSATAALAERSERANNIFCQFNLLRMVLDRHEATTQRRWLNKSKKQRREIIGEAWGDMRPSHRPDWEYLNKMRAMAPGRDGPSTDFIRDLVDA